jgi:hypothetical protein
VPHVGEERDRMRDEAVEHLDDDEREVQGDADGKGTPVAPRRASSPKCR